MKRLLNIYIPILISIVCIFFMISNLESKFPISVILTFICVIVANLVLMLVFFNKENFYFDAIISIFYLLFFIISPVLQLNRGYYPNTFLINDNYINASNLINSIFIIFYVIFRNIDIRKDNSMTIKNEFKLNIYTKVIMQGIFFAYFIPNISRIINSILNRHSEKLSQINELVVGKFILFIPLLFVFYYICQYKENNKKKDLVFAIFWMIILIICKNPFNEKRNAIGPIYISIFAVLFTNKVNTRRFFLYTMAIFIVLFPITAIVTNSNIGINEFINNIGYYIDSDLIKSQFFELHFDAYSNLNVVFEYIDLYGFSYGFQFLGAALFFVPRLLWEGKPLSSGIVIGNYLMDNYGFYFNNLSCPITAEAYLNGGIVAIVIFAYVISKWSKLSNKWINMNNYYSLLAWYMIIHLFFLLRGDLMNGIAYLFGPFTALYFLPITLEKLGKILKVKNISFSRGNIYERN